MNRFQSIIFISLYFYVSLTNALRDTQDVDVGLSLYTFDKFGFESGGSIFLNATIKDRSGSDVTLDNIYLFTCQGDTFNDYSSWNCYSSIMSGCYLNMLPLSSPALQSISVTLSEYYVFMVSTCTSDNSATITISYEFLNPDGKQLSVGDYNLPLIYILFTILRFLVSGVWLAGMISLCPSKSPIQIMIFIVAVFRFVSNFVGAIYWGICSSSGDCLAQLDYFELFVYSVGETLFFALLFMTARGWSLMIPSLPSTDLRSVAISVVLLMAALLFLSYYSQGYFYLSLMIIYFFMLPRIFSSIGRNMRIIHQHLGASRHNPTAADDARILNAKYQFYQQFRKLILLYIAAFLAVTSFRFIADPLLDWIVTLVNELVSCLALFSLMYLLFPTRTSRFAYFAGLDSPPLSQTLDAVLFAANLNNILEDAGTPMLDLNEVVIFEMPDERRFQSTKKRNRSEFNASGAAMLSLPLVVGILDKPQLQSLKGHSSSSLSSTTTATTTNNVSPNLNNNNNNHNGNNTNNGGLEQNQQTQTNSQQTQEQNNQNNNDEEQGERNIGGSMFAHSDSSAYLRRRNSDESSESV